MALNGCAALLASGMERPEGEVLKLSQEDVSKVLLLPMTSCPEGLPTRLS